jgi:hypothetical protein
MESRSIVRDWLAFFFFSLFFPNSFSASGVMMVKSGDPEL